MTPQIFITGISGYVGSQVLHRMIAKHPEYHITGLVRTKEQKQIIASRYPTVKITLGNLDSSELIELSKQADVVIQAADVDHLGIIKSSIQGLSQGKKNGAFIQLSGAASVLDLSAGLGQPTTKIWDDSLDFDEISNFNENHAHASSDQLVLSEGKRLGVRTVIVEPPLIYGKGEGIKKLQGLPDFVQIFRKRGRVFTVGEGRSIISSIHVKDIADILVSFAESAINQDCDKIEWGERGIYYAENGETASRDIMEAIARAMVERAMIETAEIDFLTGEEANEFHPFASLLWGSNMRIRATKLRALGWTPKQPSVIHTMSELFE